jgi:DNA-binding MarR family transcriptional regulator
MSGGSWTAVANAAEARVPEASNAQDEAQRRVWVEMWTLVHGDNRREEASAVLGLSFIKIKALRRLLTRPMSMRDLALELGTDKPYVTQIVDALEERGLVLRAVADYDRRCRIASLTEQGRETAVRSEEILTRPPAGLRRLSERDLAELGRILGEIARAEGD